jgi:hypothetical protein
MAEENGNVAELPGLRIAWHADKYDVTLHWTPGFTFEFLEGMLEMAKLKLEDARRFVVAQRQLAQMQEQQQAQEVVQKLHLGK